MEERDKAIALLDSGVGGLTLVRELRNLLPGENIVYFGDTARMPYGPRPAAQVQSFALEIMDFLYTAQDIKMVIVACNTATAVGLEHYRKHFPVPILGVLEPGAKAAVNLTRTKRVGVIGTEGTIASRAYPRTICQLDESVQVFDRACPMFVLVVENQLIDTPETLRVAESYLEPLVRENVDALILGCTHYPLMEHVIAQVMGESVVLVNSAWFTASTAREKLAEMDLLRSGSCGWQRFFVSGEPANFEQIGRRLLGYDLKAYRVTF